ncbi:YkvI family membrane protein [Oceanobacillus jeddahense]|uniref:Membrane protein YkvI n=1 Tax=Oceanobacillus jeddahense TaxID=1462527 RepID=A0ABY5JXW3_9BACI|nr:hypothetical protein [Oceanobacillus jeddahense]UUI03896.1 hypothetical protein NP439_04160 [Oceanobacillus jeddahense]
MKNSLRIAGAYLGVVVGAGFATGQEVIQYFTSLGIWGMILNLVIAFVLLPFFAYQIIKLGQKLHVTSHKEAVYHICGKYLGIVADILLIFFMFGFGVVMIAGSGSLFLQQYGISPAVGGLLLMIFVILTLFLNTQKIISVISIVSPYMVTLIFIIMSYSMITASDITIAEQDSIALSQPSATSHWLWSALNYVSLVVAIGFPIIAVIGTTEKNKKAARIGAIIGGIVFAFLITLMSFALYINIDTLQNTDIPTLMMAAKISPVIGFLASIGILLMIFNTAVPMFYSFTARFIQVGTLKYRIAVVVICFIAYVFGFVGFTDLVNKIFPLIGYLGLILLGAIIVNMFRLRIQESRLQADMLYEEEKENIK